MKKYSIYITALSLLAVFGCSENEKPAASDIQCTSEQTKCGEGENINTLYTCQKGAWDKGTACPDETPLCITDLKGSSACIAKPQTGPAAMLICMDGVDNDGDTLIDCADDDCRYNGSEESPGPGMTVCTEAEADPKCMPGQTKCGEGTEINTLYTCIGGIWDEGSACADSTPICMMHSDGSSACIAKPQSGYASFILCSDGLDNDGDTLIDCNDEDCIMTGTPENPGPGMNICIKNTNGECSDGQTRCGSEDEINILYTCRDGKWDSGTACSDNTPVCIFDTAGNSMCSAVPQSGYTSYILCSDGIDNDGDTLTDCSDEDCRIVGTPEQPGPGMTVCAAIEQSPELKPGDTKCDSESNQVLIYTDKNIWKVNHICSDEQICAQAADGKHECVERECTHGDTKCGEGENNSTLYECINGRWNEGVSCGDNVCGVEFSGWSKPSCHPSCKDGQMKCYEGYDIYDAYFVCQQNTYIHIGICGDFDKFACNIHDDNTVSCDACHFNESKCADSHSISTCNAGKWSAAEACPEETPDCAEIDDKSQCIKKECAPGEKKCGEGNDKDTLYECDDNYQWKKESDCRLNGGICGPEFENQEATCHKSCSKGDEICKNIDYELNIYTCNEENIFEKKETCIAYCNIYSDGKPHCDAEQSGSKMCSGETDIKTYKDGEWIVEKCPNEKPFCNTDGTEAECVECINDTLKCGTTESDKNTIYKCNNHKWEKDTDCQNGTVCGPEFENFPVSCHAPCVQGKNTCRINDMGFDMRYICNENNTYIYKEECPYSVPYCNILDDQTAKCETIPNYAAKCIKGSQLEITYNDPDKTHYTVPCACQNIYTAEAPSAVCESTICNNPYKKEKCTNDNVYYCTSKQLWRLSDNCRARGEVCDFTPDEGPACHPPVTKN